MASGPSLKEHRAGEEQKPTTDRSIACTPKKLAIVILIGGISTSTTYSILFAGTSYCRAQFGNGLSSYSLGSLIVWASMQSCEASPRNGFATNFNTEEAQARLTW